MGPGLGPHASFVLRPSAGATGPRAVGDGRSCPSSASPRQARSSRTGRSVGQGRHIGQAKWHRAWCDPGMLTWPVLLAGPPWSFGVGTATLCHQTATYFEGWRQLALWPSLTCSGLCHRLPRAAREAGLVSREEAEVQGRRDSTVPGSKVCRGSRRRFLGSRPLRNPTRTVCMDPGVPQSWPTLWLWL